MDYIWDVLIKAKNERIDLKKVRFCFATGFSPYMELSDSCINFRDIDKDIEINPYYRFFNIFKGLFDANYYKNEELRDVLFDLTVHFLGELDLNRGMDRVEYYKWFFYRELKEGVFGQKAKENIEYFSINEKNILIRNLYKLYITGDHIFYLKNAIKNIFKGSIVYLNKLDKNEFLVYIRQTNSSENLKKMELIEDLFLPINFTIKTYWKFHFGIIDVAETMRVGSTAIY
ncbi:MAG: iron-dependent peroxidase [Firmicutes bacterium]|nr:iron-dependent peroxidase [Bacillota bacterium]